MIPTFYYFLGFLIYTSFCMITFKIYAKIEDEMKKKAGLILIYFYYSILIAYIIDLADLNASGTEILIQTSVYIIAEGLFLLFYYNDINTKEIKYN